MAFGRMNGKSHGLSRDEARYVIRNPILFSDRNPRIYFVTPTPPSSEVLTAVVDYLRTTFGGVDIALLCTLKFDTHGYEKEIGAIRREGMHLGLDEDELDEIVEGIPEANIQKTKNFLFYLNKSVDLSSIIPKGSIVVSFSQAIKSVTFDAGIENESFSDPFFNDPYFYFPELQSWVFPTYGLSRIFSFKQRQPLDNFYRRYFSFLASVVIGFSPTPSRSHRPKLVEVTDVAEFFEAHADVEKVAWDLETTSLDWYDGEVICLTMSFDGKTGYYIDWKQDYVTLLDEFLKDKFSIGANLKFDIKFMRKRGAKNLSVGFDTLQAGHVINEVRNNSLKTHAYIYTKHGGYNLELEKYKADNKIVNYADFPPEMLFEYATMDAVVTFQVYEAMEKKLQEEPELRSYYYSYVLPTLNAFIDIEFEGVFINWERVKELGDQFRKEIDILNEKWFAVSGTNIPMSQTDSLREFFFNRLNWTVLEHLRTKSGAPSLTKESLMEYRNERERSEQDIEMVDVLIEYREISKLYTTYLGEEDGGKKKTGSGLWQHRKPDGKIYPQYGVMLAGTHRHKSSNPNMQNFPHHGENASLIRSLFDVPGEEWEIWSKDYAGLQLRIGSIMSGDEKMKAVWTSDNPDLHSVTAQAVFKPDLPLSEFIARKNETEINEDRLNGKRINFKFLFGGGARSFRDETIKKEWSLEQCMEYVQKNDLEIVPDPLSARDVFTRRKELEEHRNEVRSRAREEGRRIPAFPPIDEEIPDAEPDIYYTVSASLRNKFFEAYPKLKRWVEQTPFEATGRGTFKTQGYLRYVHGGRKLLTLLGFYKNINEDYDGSIKSVDYGNDQVFRDVNELQTQSLNNPVQNFESVVVNRAIFRLHNKLREEGMKSRIFVQVHDEVAFYVYKPERDRFRELATKIMDHMYKEYDGVPIVTDTEIADPRNKENPTYWGYGVSE